MYVAFRDWREFFNWISFELKQRGVPDRGSKWFAYLPIPQKLTKSKFAKIPNSHVLWGRGGVGRDQFPTFDAETKFAKISNSHVWWGRSGVGGDQFPTFDAETKRAKITNSHVWWGRGLVGRNQFLTFDSESKFAKITNSHVQGGGWLVETNFQLLMLSPNLLKSQIPMSSGEGGWWRSISNFWCWDQIC